MAKIISPSQLNHISLIEVIDLLISDLFMNSEHFEKTSSTSRYKQESRFYFIKAKPNITLKDYMLRFQSFTECSKEILILGFIYFDRIIQKNKLQLTRLNIHKLLVTSFLMALKYHEDITYDNNFFSKIAGIRPEDLTQLQIEFLELIEFQLFVDEDSYRSLLINLSTLFNIRA